MLFKNKKDIVFKKRPILVILSGIWTLLVWMGIPFMIVGPPIQITHLTTLLLFLIFFILKIISGNGEIFYLPPALFYRVRGLLLSILFIIIAGLLSSLNADVLFEVIKFEIGYLIGLTVIIVWLGSNFKEEHVNFILQCLIGGGVLSVVLTLGGFIFPQLGQITVNQFGRGEGFLLHPNQFGIMLGAIIPLAAAQLTENYRSLTNWLVLFLLLAGIVISGSKTNLFVAGSLGFFTLLLISFLKSSPIRKYLSLLATFLIISLAGYISIILLQEFVPKSLENLEALWANPQSYRTFIIRKNIWADALSLVQQYPLLGIGAGNTWVMLGAKHAHNVFIEYYLTMGILGLVALTFFILSLTCFCRYAFWLARKTGPSQQAQVIGFIFGIFAYILSNQLSDSFSATTLPILWALVGLLLVKCSLFYKS